MINYTLSVEFGFKPHKNYKGDHHDFRCEMENKIEKRLKAGSYKSEITGAGIGGGFADISVGGPVKEADKVASLVRNILFNNKMAVDIGGQITLDQEDIF